MNNKGWILIFVLIVITVCVTGVIVIENWTSENCKWTQSLYEINQQNLYILSSLKIVRQFLEEDNNHYDAPDELWANIPPFLLENATVSITVIPTNARINLNLLLSENKNVRKRVEEAVKEILLENGLEEEAIKDILDWIDSRRGYDETYYSTHIPFYRPRKVPFYSLKEINYVKGLKNFSYKFHQYFSVDTESEKININFANEEVIRAYLPEIAQCVDKIVKDREEKPFTNITQLRNMAEITDEDYLAVQPFITTKSDMFAVRIEVTFEDNTYYATALLKRSSKNVQIMKYFEGKGFYE